MRTKEFSATFKAIKGDDGQLTGEVVAVVSVFGNVDLVGDRVVKGAFEETLKEWRESGDPIPMIWSHDWSNPMSSIGDWDAEGAKETDEGLELPGRVHIGIGNAVADHAFHLMSKRLVRDFSFAYDVRDEKKAEDGANELLDLVLIEAGPTLKGANSATRLVEAKAAEVMDQLAKAGRALSAKNETSLREAAAAIQAGAKSIETVLESVAVDAEKSAKNVYEPIPGSDEAKRGAVSSAVRAWAEAAYDDEKTWIDVVATYPDTVIVAVNQDGKDAEYLEFTYSSEGDDVTLGDPSLVKVSVTVERSSETDGDNDDKELEDLRLTVALL